MAFNFNWSPLIADTTRAKDMLTTALNKSPKPPIIVDDIIVTELNLGSTPPDLEILEIGDLAEDRFRGIFKMSYTGDAFLTLKTRVQANPLNTYLSTKPSFASPQPLAAASSLTIPLSITLSDFRLSGFVILVFSRQKGLTLVFRNDPLESLKVSSTFDSIPFVRNYLQKEIEGQLRVLFMEDLPAILHRLSLRLWSPDYQDLDDKETIEGKETPYIDPLASPPQDPFDASRDAADERNLPEWSLENTEAHATFSSKNILRLVALSESQKTLSLFTPSIQGAVFRAWAGAAERNENSGLHTPPLTLSALSRVNSTVNVSSTVASSISEGSDAGTLSSRPSLSTSNSLYNGLASGGIRNRTTSRKRKKRVINLRRTNTDEKLAPVENSSSAQSNTLTTLEENLEELHLPVRTPQRGVRFHKRDNDIDTFDNEDPHGRRASTHGENSDTPRPIILQDSGPVLYHPQPSTPSKPSLLPSASFEKLSWPSTQSASSASSSRLPSSLASPITESSMSGMASTGGILEQAWMMKMAKEIAKKVAEERDHEQRRSSPGERDDTPWKGGRHVVGDAPPAYVE